MARTYTVYGRGDTSILVRETEDGKEIDSWVYQLPSTGHGYIRNERGEQYTYARTPTATMYAQNVDDLYRQVMTEVKHIARGAAIAEAPYYSRILDELDRKAAR